MMFDAIGLNSVGEDIPGVSWSDGIYSLSELGGAIGFGQGRWYWQASELYEDPPFSIDWNDIADCLALRRTKPPVFSIVLMLTFFVS